MSSRDTDFEFDFFEEPETQEAPGRSDRTLRRPLRGGRGPRMPRGPIRPRTGFTPLLRLLGLIAFAILIVVLLLLWVQSCQEDAKRDAYSNYMTSISAIGRDSERVGRELSDVLTTPGDQAGRAAEAAQRPRPAAGDRRRPRAQARSARAAPRCARAGGRGACVPRRRPRGPRRGVPADAGLEGRRRGGCAARLAGRAARRQRRRLGRPLQGTERRRAADGEHQRCRGARLQLRPDAGPREHALDGADLGADQRLGRVRLDHRHAERAPRDEHRVGEGRPGRTDALGVGGEHRRGLDRSRVRGRGRKRR